jgi:hypothetical protein
VTRSGHPFDQAVALPAPQRRPAAGDQPVEGLAGQPGGNDGRTGRREHLRHADPDRLELPEALELGVARPPGDELLDEAVASVRVDEAVGVARHDPSLLRRQRPREPLP